MKQRLLIILVFVLLAAANVILEFQLRCAQMEFQGMIGVTDELCLAINNFNNPAREVIQKIPGIKTNVKAKN
jgi:hypothetical protein